MIPDFSVHLPASNPVLVSVSWPLHGGSRINVSNYMYEEIVHFQMSCCSWEYNGYCCNFIYIYLSVKCLYNYYGLLYNSYWCLYLWSELNWEQSENHSCMKTNVSIYHSNQMIIPICYWRCMDSMVMVGLSDHQKLLQCIFMCYSYTLLLYNSYYNYITSNPFTLVL